MKRAIIFSGLGIAMLAGTSVLGAPRAARQQVAGAVPPTTIEVYRDYGGVGGRHAGAGEGWTLRANGSVERTVALTPAEAQDAGATHIPRVWGTFDKGDFTRLARFLQSSRLLDLKARSAPDEISGSLRISAVRGGKRTSILLPEPTRASAVSDAGWVALTLVRGMTAGTDWKDAAGSSVNTGLHGSFIRTADGLEPKESYRLDTPVFSVRNNVDKEVGSLAASSESGYFRVVLPPGTYHLAAKGPGGAPGPSRFQPKGYAWRAVPATVQVQAGSLTPVSIRLERLSSVQ